jgi:isopentenyl diphosphate isomerase/L-lactate dehydrogenase-like FMN-dependent dehydrogenase
VESTLSTEVKPVARDPVNIFEYEELARESLPKSQYDFIAGGATDEITLRRTRDAYDALVLRPRMLVDVSNLDTRTTVLGQEIPFPIMMDPAGDHGRAHPEAERATVRAAGSLGTVMVVSSAATFTMEEVAHHATGPIWFQQYLFRDRDLTKEMTHRAEEAGYSVICVTLDSKVKPKRERNIRNQYVSISPPNYDGLELKPYAWEFTPDAPKGLNDIRDPAATWEDLDKLMENTSLPVIVKGVMTGEDGRLCVEHGVSGIIVSNHGARQLDTTLATIEVLPEVVEAVEGRCEVYLDGGIRRGADVVKALALGARAVLIGRPMFWGLAVNGEEGVKRVVRILVEEMEMTMAMCGRPTVESLDRSLLTTVSPLYGDTRGGLRLPQL